MQKVAAYCRVSTDKEDQINSLESQKDFFRDYISRNSCWELTEVYVDEGITGTSTKKRYAFNKMILDAENHEFDLIITKEISRFARNTLDSIFYTRKLKELGIGIIFMNDNINTLDSDAELRLTIMSSIAQEESRKTSERVKWGQKRRMEQGIVFGRDMVGYDVKNGKLYINPKGAEIIQMIFHKFTNEGKGTHVIARELQEAGIPTVNHMKKWSNVVILRILKNEKYTGDLIQKKTYTPNYLNHEKKFNFGEEEFVILRNHHEPIISQELFERTKSELERRSPTKEQKVKHSNRYCFSGKIKCGNCGCSYVSRVKNRRDGTIYKTWKCYEAVNHGLIHQDNLGKKVGCNGQRMKETDLKLLMQQVVRNLQIENQDIPGNLIRIIKDIVSIEDHSDGRNKLQNQINRLTDKKLELVELYLSKEISKSDYQHLNQKYLIKLDDMEKELKEQISQENELNREQEIEHKKKLQDTQLHLIKDIRAAIDELVSGEIWDDTFYRNILDKIVVIDGNHLEIFLHSLPCKWSCTLK